MKRILSGIILVLLLFGAAFAEEADPLARYEALLQREEAIRLEMQIADLEVQLARVNGNDSALALAELRQMNLQQELTTLMDSKEALARQCVADLRNEQSRLLQEAESLNSQMAALEAALADNAARQEELRTLLLEHLSLGGMAASSRGFLADVTVHLLLDDAGRISALHVDASQETPFMGARCGEDEAFLSQFIGQTGPFTIGVNVDALSGATVTSKAVAAAINSLLISPEATPSYTVSRVEYSTAAKGLLSDVWVTITLDEAGAIATLTVDCSGETAAIAAPCTQAPFISQFIGRRGPFTDIDVVAGATYTSNAVIQAVNSLFSEEGADLQ